MSVAYEVKTLEDVASLFGGHTYIMALKAKWDAAVDAVLMATAAYKPATAAPLVRVGLAIAAQAREACLDAIEQLMPFPVDTSGARQSPLLPKDISHARRP